MIYYIIEAFFVILTFFLPGYFLPRLEDPNDFLNSPLHLSIYLTLSLLQIIFMIFILHRNKSIPLKDFGWVKPRVKDILQALLFIVGLYALYYLLMLVISMLPQMIQETMISGFRWKLENLVMIPFIFIFCLITGYREELLFRSYIITRCSQFSIPVPYAIIISVFSFGVLHLYEGISGILFAFFSGIYLSLIFVAKKNLHIIAVSHGIFNFTALLLSYYGIE
ncbi:MAG: CPBP family intramembrane metalloprotease [Spirochaetales bacterium]|nr:CPBP family intramembrane metalloprotease [Spirochaetales bacterium]